MTYQANPEVMFDAQHQFLEWNRAQPAPLVRIAYEYAVAEKAVELYLAALPPQAKAEPAGVSDEALELLRNLKETITPGADAPHRGWNDIYRDGIRSGIDMAIGALSAAPSTGVREDADGVRGCSALGGACEWPSRCEDAGRCAYGVDGPLKDRP